MKRLLENPAVLGASAILGAIGIVLMAASALWFGNDLRERSIDTEDLARGISTLLTKQNETLNQAAARAQAKRTQIMSSLDRRLDKLETEHKWLSTTRSSVNEQPSSKLEALEGALGRCMIGNNELIRKLEQCNE